MHSTLNTSPDFDIEKKLRRISRHTQNEVFPQSVQHFLLFLGFPRSGNSFLGQLINAHPNALVANEGKIYKHANIKVQNIYFKNIEKLWQKY